MEEAALALCRDLSTWMKIRRGQKNTYENSHAIESEAYCGANKRCAHCCGNDRASKSASAFGRGWEFYIDKEEKARHEQKAIRIKQMRMRRGDDERCFKI